MDDAEVLAYHATSSGLAVLAFADPDFVDNRLAEPLQTHTPQTVTDPAMIRTLLQDITRTGIAESIGGFEAEVHSLAVPVFGPNRSPIGALAVATPVSRMSPSHRQITLDALKDAGTTLTNRIGGVAPDIYPTEVTT
jgi:DNA-binding IclR family transcriptional regulator